MAEVALAQPQNLPVAPTGRHGLGWWGVGTLVASEAALFAYLLFAYFYTGATAPSGLAARAARRVSNWRCPIWCCCWSRASRPGWASRASSEAAVARRSSDWASPSSWASCSSLVQCLEWRSKPYRLGDSSYSSLYFVTHGTAYRACDRGASGAGGAFAGGRPLTTSAPGGGLRSPAGALYWHFVDVVWLFVFSRLIT